MLNILGRRQGKRPRGSIFCDGLSRRGFLKIGGLAFGGLSLPQLLALEDGSLEDGSPKDGSLKVGAGRGRSHKALINIFLPGGPSHLDLWDLKPDAPSNIRGEFRPIKTNVPGIEICELFPRMAKMMDKFVPVRSIVGSEGSHSGFQCMTGRKQRGFIPAGGWPASGSYVSKLEGQTKRGMPPHVSLMYRTGHREWGQPGTGGFLGPAHAPVSLVGSSQKMGPSDDMVLGGISLERLHHRQTLLGSLDTFRRDADRSGVMEGMDHYTQEAMNILTSSGLVKALDLSQEDPRILERYGADDSKFQRDGAPKMVRNFLVARRLIEAGARVVSLNYSRWDWHGGDGLNFPRSRQEFPLLDRGLSALVTDLHERGLEKDVTVIAWGEFGRTPKINKMNSRDHWPRVSCAMMAGGGMQTGQIIGATNALGEYAKERPVTFQDVFATLYHNLGIDVNTATVDDRQGRPTFLVDADARPIHELI